MATFHCFASRSGLIHYRIAIRERSRLTHLALCQLLSEWRHFDFASIHHLRACIFVHQQYQGAISESQTATRETYTLFMAFGMAKR